MSRIVKAIFENGAFQPLEPVSCRDQEEVLLTVEPCGNGGDIPFDSEFLSYCTKLADDSATLHEVREGLATISGSVSKDIRFDRDQR